jgi:hypothetical protein
MNGPACLLSFRRKQKNDRIAAGTLALEPFPHLMKTLLDGAWTPSPPAQPATRFHFAKFVPYVPNTLAFKGEL